MRDKSDLRPVQQRVVTALYEADPGIQVVMRMGAGKTVCALTAIRELLDDGEIRAAVAFAPATVARNTWLNEVADWSHLSGLRVEYLPANPQERAAALRRPADVYISSIDAMQQVIDLLRKEYEDDDPRWDLFVVDEISRFRAPRGERFKKLNRNLKRVRCIWGLTGTPRPNGWEDQWAPIQMVSRGAAWGTGFDDWRRRHFMPMDYQARKWEIHEFAKPAVSKVIDAYTVTVPPEDDATQTFLHGPEYDHVVDLGEAAQETMRSLEEELLAETGIDIANDADPDDDDTFYALSEAIATGKMAQVVQGFMYGPDGSVVNRYHPLVKLDALQDMLEGLNGEPALIAYHFAEDLNALQRLLGATAPRLGAEVSEKRAAQTIEAWNNREIKHLLIHPASAGHGLNLQYGGSRIIWYSPTWSPELYAQTCMRLARPGQEETVYSHRIVADHPFEHRRTARVEHKLSEQDEFIETLRRI